jgi:hypothetical protein
MAGAAVAAAAAEVPLRPAEPGRPCHEAVAVGAPLVRKHLHDYQGQVGLPPGVCSSQFSARNTLRVAYLIGDVEAFALVDSNCPTTRPIAAPWRHPDDDCAGRACVPVPW